ncbi:cobalt-precorrin-6A reductase [Rhodomicrobium sp.]|uniref:cobalt-precorrin-6A reductase n=1 Tax=Rhodomicrobium sp. TaxID=2720632 RepID=UPI0039E2300D
MRLLILGGTADASALAKLLAGDLRFEPTLSLAGRTVSPVTPPIPFRIGGFGGAEGLATYLRDERVDAMIDATHPFAARISANAVKAAQAARVPLASLLRPAWARQEGDRWISVPSPEAAAAALGDAPRTVFLTVGRLELPAFAAAPQHRYVARVIDRPEGVPLPPDLAFIEARGPYDTEAELRLMRQGGFDVIVSKNSGGAATCGKIEAARALGLPVVMIERPDKPAGHVLGSATEAVAWLETLLAARDHSGARSDRGV